MRQCAVTRLRRRPEELIRFAVDPEGRVVPDLKAVLPGRGVWVTAARDIIEQAVRRGAFARAYRRSVKTEPGLPGQVEELLERDALQRLSLANKAGLATFGFVKVAEAIEHGRVTALIHASDAADDGSRKLDGKFFAMSNGPDGRGAIVRCFDSGQLGLALGRPNVVHAAMRPGGASDKFLAAVARLQGFREGSAEFAAA